MSELHLKKPAFTYSAYRLITKNNAKTQNLQKQEIQKNFIETNYKKRVFNMILLVDSIQIYLKQLLIKFHAEKHSTLLDILILMAMKKELPYNFLTKKMLLTQELFLKCY